MKQGIILYQSKYGATQKYANWLSDKTGFDCIAVDKADMKQIQQYDVIVLGGAIYASGISGLSFLKKHMEALRGKRLVVFCVGASPYDTKAVEQIHQHNLKGKLKNIPCFYCRGAWDENIMSFKDRSLCKMLQKAVSRKDPSACESWEVALIEAIGKKCDWTDETYLTPLLDYLSQQK